MTILLTGVAGFIGSHLAEAFCRQNWQVIGIDNLSSGTMDNMMEIPKKNFTFIRSDVRDIEKHNLPAIDVIVHLAASGSVPRSMVEPDHYMHNNVLGFHAILE